MGSSLMIKIILIDSGPCLQYNRRPFPTPIGSAGSRRSRPMEDDGQANMELRRTLRNRLEDLQGRVEATSSEAFERVLHDRMDTYFTQEERLLEMEMLLSGLRGEIDRAHELQGLRQLAERLNFLEDHLEDIDSKMFDRPVRRRPGRFNIFEFFRRWHAGQSDGTQNEFTSESEAYRELGIEPGAGLKSVKASFRRLVKGLHPDQRGGDRSAEPRLRRLVAAYEFIRKRTPSRGPISR